MRGAARTACGRLRSAAEGYGSTARSLLVQDTESGAVRAVRARGRARRRTDAMRAIRDTRFRVRTFVDFYIFFERAAVCSMSDASLLQQAPPPHPPAARRSPLKTVRPAMAAPSASAAAAVPSEPFWARVLNFGRAPAASEAVCSVSSSNTSGATSFAAAPEPESLSTVSPSAKLLIVMVHGLGGQPGDLAALEEALGNENSRRRDFHVHLAQCNAPGRSLFAALNHPTQDGIEAGGRRLAEEIRQLRRVAPQLSHISLVGNSLGGLYCRYAAALLFDADSGTVAGLQPVHFLTTASPHLGVGQHGHLSLIPRPLQTLGASFLGASIRQLLLGDGPRPLLLRMASEETSGDDLPFLPALRAFQYRTLYANAVNDFLVAYETAAIAPNPTAAPRPAPFRGEPRVLYTRERAAEAEELEEAEVEAGADVAAWQRRMARGLSRGMSWREVCVVFPSLFPIAHNRIVALRRDAFVTALNAVGQGVVQTQAQELLRGWGGEETR